MRDPQGVPVNVETPKPLDAKLPPSHPSNQAAIQFVSTTDLPQPLRELYGKFLSCRIMMRRAQWLMAMGRVPNLWKVRHFGLFIWDNHASGVFLCYNFIGTRLWQ